MPSVLTILAEGFEEIEAIVPIDLLRRAGAEVTVAALTDCLFVTGRSGVVVRADTTLAAVESRSFDALVLPGGPGVVRLRTDPRVLARVRRQDAAGAGLAAICAAPTVLLEAGVLGTRRHTAHFSVAAALPRLETGPRTIEDGHLLTSPGAGTSLDFGLALVARLFSPAKAAEIARSICA
jgi:4-methyl-5(b-hydroxyethyl)-thiazole monophosphate biosynthesis